MVTAGPCGERSSTDSETNDSLDKDDPIRKEGGIHISLPLFITIIAGYKKSQEIFNSDHPLK
jgi:hypothetical protein